MSASTSPRRMMRAGSPHDGGPSHHAQSPKSPGGGPSHHAHSPKSPGSKGPPPRKAMSLGIPGGGRGGVGSPMRMLSVGSPRSPGGGGVAAYMSPKSGEISDKVIRSLSGERFTFNVPDALLEKRPLLHHWIQDMWTIVHNGLRIELGYMYKALVALHRKGEKITNDDLLCLFKWWKDFYNYLRESCDVYDSTILRWLASMKITLQTNEKRLKILGTCENVLNKYEALSGGKNSAKWLLSSLTPDINTFGKHTLVFFDEEEASVKRILDRYDLPEDKNVEKEYWGALLKAPHGAILYAISTQWMSKKSQKTFADDKLGVFAAAKAKKATSQLEKKHETTLFTLIDKDLTNESMSQSVLANF